MADARKDARLELLAATSEGGRVTDRIAIELPSSFRAAPQLDAADEIAAPDSPLYLVLENVGIDGGDASAMWDVYVGTTDGPEAVGTITPFGLAGLTAKGGRQTLSFDITHLASRLADGPLEVTFEAAYANVEHEPYWERAALYTTEP
jgi:hypothetical protein